MSSPQVLALLAILAGAGITGAAVLFSAQVPPEGAKLAATSHTTFSSGAAAAWQAIRRPVAPASFEPEQATVASIGPRAPLPVETSAPALDRRSLTRALQREVKSVGCYHGEINGVWTTSTRQAMKTFTDRANARLPVTEPDQVLLALIKGNRHFGCNERLIQAITAQPLPLDKTAKTPPVEPAPLLTPPMALAGPKTTETDGGNIAAPPEELAPKTSRRRVVAGSQERSKEHWSAKLWRNAGN
jgi:hypothetical protein